MTFADGMELAIFLLLLLWFVMDRGHVYFRGDPYD